MKLEGIRVLDLSLFLPGPAMTQAMADHGAAKIFETGDLGGSLPGAAVLVSSR